MSKILKLNERKTLFMELKLLFTVGMYLPEISNAKCVFCFQIMKSFCFQTVMFLHVTLVKKKVLVFWGIMKEDLSLCS